MTNIAPAIKYVRPGNVRYVPGDLYWNPTDLTDPDAYGEYLGSVAASIDYRPGFQSVGITDETFMGEDYDYVKRNPNPMLFALLMEHTPLVYKLGFSGYNIAGRTGHRIDSRAMGGRLASAVTSGRLLFLPHDRDNHDCLLIYRAIPELDSQARLVRKYEDAMLMPVVFKAVKNPAGKIVLEDKLENLAITLFTLNSIAVSMITEESARITWSTSVPATSLVRYGIYAGGPYQYHEPLSGGNTLVTSHSVDLTGLDTETEYYFVVESTDADGNTQLGAEGNFTTDGGGSPPA